MDKVQKLLLALERRAKGKPKVKAKIKEIKKRQSHYNWLAT